MSTVELIAAAAVATGVLAVLWLLARRAAGGSSAQLTEEQSAALEGAAILMADDSVTIQKVVELTFMDSAARVICVSDGQAAADLLLKETFDAVIADVHMPERNGYEVCEHAKRLRPEVAVLLLVGAFERLDEDLYRRCGADGVLKKPFDAAALLGIVSGLLERRYGPQRLPGATTPGLRSR